MDFVETPYPLKAPTRAKLKQVQEDVVSQEEKEMLEKGDNSSPGPVCQPSVPSTKEGWRATISDQPEGVEYRRT